MDKFSLFKLLNSFSKLLSEKDAQSSTKQTDLDISSLFKKEQKVETPPKRQPNFSTSYLTAIKNHQDFVKRVTQSPKNKD